MKRKRRRSLSQLTPAETLSQLLLNLPGMAILVVEFYALSFYWSKNYFGSDQIVMDLCKNFGLVQNLLDMDQNAKFITEKLFLIRSKTIWMSSK